MTEIAIFILLLLIGSVIVLAIVLQFKEQARQEKLRKLTRLDNQLRLLRSFIDDIPSQYQPKDMRIWLFSRVVAVCDEIQTLKTDTAIAKKRSRFAEELKRFQGNQDNRKPKPINDELLISGLKRLFESLRSYILLAHKEKQLSLDVVQRYESLLMLYKYQVSADFYAFQAKQAYLNGKKENAIQIYKEAISQLAPIKDTPQVVPIIDDFNAVIADINAEITAPPVDDNLPNKNTEALDEEWEQFIDESTFTEKKRF
ncbi:hypothetical protein ACUM5Y_01875 [Marinomonas dokdonensis]|uniref:hypothetical protein n=1 Tax=Marinomonas dokdonensis TaxID=328224 RepID=UPI0040556165